jgi:outer membrane protease
MPKRNLRIVTQDVPIVGICEACNAQFKSFNVDEAERVVKAQFDAHECEPLDASQAAVRIVREATSMTPKRKLWLWIASWTALATAAALMWPWDWAGW